MLGLATKQTLGRVAAAWPGTDPAGGRHAATARLTGRHGEARRWESRLRTSGGIAEVIIDFPPVNALPVQGWFDLADAVTRRAPTPAVRAGGHRRRGARLLRRAWTSRRCSSAPGHEALIGANRGASPRSPRSTTAPVPVIAAVHGFCLGGGVGLAGNADIVIAADGATFGLPEVDRGALGAATHLARLVPQQLMRADGLHLPHGHRRSSCSAFGTGARASCRRSRAARGRARRRRARSPPRTRP